MYHTSAYRRYAALQAQADAANEAAKLAEAEWLAAEAIRQEEEALKARLFDIEQRKKYSQQFNRDYHEVRPMHTYGLTGRHSHDWTPFASTPSVPHLGHVHPYSNKPNHTHCPVGNGLRVPPHLYSAHEHPHPGAQHCPDHRASAPAFVPSGMEECPQRRKVRHDGHAKQKPVIDKKLSQSQAQAQPTHCPARESAAEVPVITAARRPSPAAQPAIGFNPKDAANDLINLIFGPEPSSHQAQKRASPTGPSKGTTTDDVLKLIFGDVPEQPRMPTAPVSKVNTGATLSGRSKDLTQASPQANTPCKAACPAKAKAPSAKPAAAPSVKPQSPDDFLNALFGLTPTPPRPLSSAEAASRAATEDFLSAMQPMLGLAPTPAGAAPRSKATAPSVKKAAAPPDYQALTNGLIQEIFGAMPRAQVPAAPTKKPAAQPNQADKSLLETLRARSEGSQEARDTATAITDSPSTSKSKDGSSEPSKAAPSNDKAAQDAFIERLKARLETEHDQEVKDTIQATLNSLAPTATKPVPIDATSKGKAKATPSPSAVFSLKRVERIESAFKMLQSEFVFPAQLDFTNRPATMQSAETSEALAHLAFTARNHPVRFYEQSLLALLTGLDSIESKGDMTVRSKRKETVRLIECALEALEGEVVGRWKASLEKRGESSESSSALSSVNASPVQEAKAELPHVTPTVTIPIADGDNGVEDAELLKSTPIPSAILEETPANSSGTSSLADETLNEPKPSQTVNELDLDLAPESDSTDFNNASVEDSQLTVRASEVQPAANSASIPVPASEENESQPLSYAQVVAQSPSNVTLVGEPVATDLDAASDAASDSGDGESFLLSQTQAKERKLASHNSVEIEDIGSDWSELESDA